MTEVSEFRPFTPNEQFGSLLNRIEDHRLVRLLKRFDAENKQNFLGLNRTKQEVQCSVQKISVSTGHYSIKPVIELLPKIILLDMNRHPSKSKSQKQQSYSKSAKSSSNKTENKKKSRYHDDSDEEKTLKMKMSRSESIRGNGLNSMSNKPFGYRNVQSALPNFSSQRRSTTMHEETLKSFQAKRTEMENNSKKMREREKSRGLIFDDDNLQAIYVKLCAQRDRIQKFDAERIESLKKADPVFAKRYKQFQNAKIINKAPSFDMNDFNVPMNIFKIDLPVKPASAKQRKPVVETTSNEQTQSNESIQNQKTKYFQLKMQQMDLKVKDFIKSCEKGLCSYE